MAHEEISEFKHDVYSKRKRRIMILFTFPLIFKSNQWKKGKNLLFTINANIFTKVYKRLKAEGKKFKFCRLPFVVNVMLKLSNNASQQTAPKVMNEK